MKIKYNIKTQLLIFSLFLNTTCLFSSSWQSFTIDGSQNTMFTGVENSLLVGVYNSTEDPPFITQGFSKSGSLISSPINYPDAGYTRLTGTDGALIVGYYNDGVQGLIYNGTSWSAYSSPWPLYFNDQGFYFDDISEGRIIGKYYSASSSNPSVSAIKSFIFTPNASNWEIIKGPNNEEENIIANGIDGNNIIGNFGSFGFLFNGITWETLISPWDNASFEDISGSLIVGNAGNHGFIYDGESWTSIEGQFEK